MIHWIDDKLVENALLTKSITDIENSGVKFCISKDFKYCVLIRKHLAWEIENEGWRDANKPPKKNETWRWIINFYKKDNSWFKVFVPLKYEIIEIKEENKHFSILTSTESIIGKFSSHENLMWDVMSGHSETEDEIERKFLLIGRK